MNPRISVVRYLNTAPLVWGMIHGDARGRFDLAFTTPAGCADDLRAGRADAGIIPSIEYQRMEGLQVLPGISIASKYRARSVLLLSRVPIEQVRSLALDNSSRTSAALVMILLRKFYGIDVRAAPHAPDPEAMLREADAALLIGDAALTYRGDARVCDLATEWRRFTGLPFVFAFWAGARSAEPGRLLRDFERSREEGLAHLAEIAAEYAPRLGLSRDDVRLYLSENMDYTLDEENLEGLRLFYRLAAETGAIAGVKALEFA